MGSARCVRDSFRFSVFSSLNFLFCPFFSLLKFRTRGYWLFFVVSIICLSFFSNIKSPFSWKPPLLLRRGNGKSGVVVVVDVVFPFVFYFLFLLPW